MNNSNYSETFPLSTPQREILFDQLITPEFPSYNVGGYVQIEGPINPSIMQETVNVMIERFDSLRMVLVQSESLPQQRYLNKIDYTLPVFDYSEKDLAKEKALEWMQEQMELPFNLYGEQLFRFALIKTGQNKNLFIWVFHHLVTDGWGAAIFDRKLGEIYTALLKGETINICPPSYVSFIEDDQKYLESDKYRKDLEHWTAKYQTLPDQLLSPRYESSASKDTRTSDRSTLWIDRNVYAGLHKFASSQNSNLFHVLIGALYVYFTRTSRSKELVMGLPILNRSKAVYKETIGLFVGLCSTRFSFSGELSFVELLKKIQRTLKADYRHQKLPIGELNRALGIHKEGKKQLFDIQFNYVKQSHDSTFDNTASNTVIQTSNHDFTPLTICVWEFHENRDIQIDFVFNKQYFTTEEVEQLQARLMEMLQFVKKSPDERIENIPIYTSNDLQVLKQWWQTEKDYPTDKTVIDLFEEQATKNPDSIAVDTGEKKLSYSELNQKANQLAHALKAERVDCETLVGVYMERSAEFLVCMLGILKTGGAYLPIDVRYPLERIRHMVEDSEISLLLTQEHLLNDLVEVSVKKALSEKLAEVQEDTENPGRNTTQHTMAYMIYTSGSTGKPKGVIIEHRSLTNLIYWHTEHYGITESDKSIQAASIAFDASVLEIWPLLCSGGCVCPIPDNIWTGSSIQLKGWMKELKITFAFIPTAMMNNYPSDVWETPNMRTITTGGDVLHAIPPADTSYTMCNVYGPTETTAIITSTKIAEGLNISGTKLPYIGRPMTNVQIYLLDEKLNLLPPGVPGEVCIAGACLGRGYWNSEELNREKFTTVNILEKELRIYRSGDLARWTPDGQLEFLGRIDNQVQLRGYRVELGEIEAVLVQHASVDEAVVILQNADSSQTASLVAYVTLAGKVDDLAAEFNTWLKKQLPDYMIPSHFIELEKIPATINGKVDRKALPLPELVVAESKATIVPPKTDTEKQIAEIWKETLKLKKICIHDNFFDLGGNSLISMQIASKIHRNYKVNLSIDTFFKATTIEQLATELERLLSVRENLQNTVDESTDNFVEIEI